MLILSQDLGRVLVKKGELEVLLLLSIPSFIVPLKIINIKNLSSLYKKSVEESGQDDYIFIDRGLCVRYYVILLFYSYICLCCNRG